MASHCSKAPRIDVSRLPNISPVEMDFRDTSFFQHDSSRQLPTPDAILLQFTESIAGVVKIEYLNLAVKIRFEKELNFEEAQTLRAIKHAWSKASLCTRHGHLSWKKKRYRSVVDWIVSLSLCSKSRARNPLTL